MVCTLTVSFIILRAEAFVNPHFAGNPLMPKQGSSTTLYAYYSGHIVRLTSLCEMRASGKNTKQTTKLSRNT